MAKRIEVPGMGVVEFPDDMGDDQIATAIKRNSSMRGFESAKPKPLGPPEELTFGEKVMQNVSLPSWMDNLRGSKVGGWMQGMADMQVGAVQTAANLLPDSTGIPQAVNKRVAEQNQQYETARAQAGREGMDISRGVGNITNPTNIAMAARLPVATTALARAGQGALVGGAGGAAAPVENTDNGFWGAKAAQVGVGAVTGAVLTPVLGKVADLAIRKVGLGRSPNVRASSHDVDAAIGESLKEAGQSVSDVPPDQLAALRQQVSGALGEGRQMDAAAALRNSDFQALGMKGTLGQIARDPMQFAREQNLRGVEGVGEPLLAHFQQQGQQLQTKLPASGAKNAYQAGTQFNESLSGIDDTIRRHVSGLYGEARASTGKVLDVPLQGFAADYADILHRYADKLPKGVQNVLNDYGLAGGTQTKVFTFEEADKVLKAINSNRSNDPATNSALGELRGALRKTLEGVDSSGGPFAPAVRAAAGRFKLHDAIPALKAASEGSVAPDDFVRKFVINGKTDEVKGLANVLKQADKPAYDEARAQLADELRRAAFGENMAGDSPFSPTRYMQTVRRIGVDKLGAFFDAQEVTDILRVGRVGSYIKQAPNGSAVNNSNTAGALMNLASKIPGASPLISIGNRAVNTVQNNATVRNALAAEIPVTDAPFSEAQRNWLAYILGIGGAGGGAAAGGAIGQ